MKLEEVCYTNVQALYLQKQMKATERERKEWKLWKLKGQKAK